MTNDNTMTKLSKFLSLVLRHKPEAAGIALDKNGWADVSDLLTGVRNNYGHITMSMLEEIVANDNKQRYSFDKYHKKIRANQGHSVQVDLGLIPVTPPDVLYHGTSMKYFGGIMGVGLIKKSRNHVHLSEEPHTAITVGSRHGNDVVVFLVNARQMHTDGYEFFKSENGVWLTDSVPSKYLTTIMNVEQ